MTWLTWLLTLATLGVNLHALITLVLGRGAPAPMLRRLAKRSSWLAFTFIVLSMAADVLIARQAMMSAVNSADPSTRAMALASGIAGGMNCAAMSALGALLPVFAALWLRSKARRS